MPDRFEINKAGLPIRIREGRMIKDMSALGIEKTPQSNYGEEDESQFINPETGRIECGSNAYRIHVLRKLIRKISQGERPETYDDGWC